MFYTKCRHVIFCPDVACFPYVVRHKTNTPKIFFFFSFLFQKSYIFFLLYGWGAPISSQYTVFSTYQAVSKFSIQKLNDLFMTKIKSLVLYIR